MFQEVSWVYPQGKNRAVTFSYDDGQRFDERVVKVLNAHGMKGTFNLCSSLVQDPAKAETYLQAEEVPQVYRGHEVAVHGVHHPYLERLAPGQVLAEVLEDRRNLERIMGRPVTGMAYPYGSWNAMVLEQLRAAGIQYSRTTQATGRFSCPEEWLTWHPTCHHREALPLVEAFRNQRRSLSLFYIWGHSYEFANDNNWDLLEKICDALPRDQETWYATNGEIHRYVQAMQRLVFTADQDMAYNPTDQELWFLLNHRTLRSLPPGECVALK